MLASAILICTGCGQAHSPDSRWAPKSQVDASPTGEPAADNPAADDPQVEPDDGGEQSSPEGSSGQDQPGSDAGGQGATDGQADPGDPEGGDSSGETGGSGTTSTPPPQPLRVTTFNAALVPGVIPFTEERLLPVVAALAEQESDILCLQEIWRAEDQQLLIDEVGKAFNGIG